MKKIPLLIAMSWLTIAAAGQDKIQVAARQSAYKADLDGEFDIGSNITSIQLDKRRIEDLFVLGKVWGFVKYHHPALQKGEYNWDYELFRVLPKIMQCKTDNERNAILLTWITQLGQFKTTEIQQPDSSLVKIYPDIQWINEASVLGEPLAAQLNEIRNAKRESSGYYMAPTPRVGNPDLKNEKRYAHMPYPDAGFRLLALYRYWNIIQYFFPYKNLIGENWNNVLTEFIPAFVNAGSEQEYKKSVLALIARVHDTHANVWMLDPALEKMRGLNAAPVNIRFVENKAVVIGYFHPEWGLQTGLQKGDIITGINGKSVESIVKENLPYTPASNYPTQLRDLAYNLLRSADTIMTITYQRGDAMHTNNIRCYPRQKVNPYKRSQDTCFKYMTSDIAYVYPGTIKNAYIPKVMPEFMKTKGMIIDFRCYPSDNMFVVFPNYLFPEPKRFVRVSVPDAEHPGLFTYARYNELGKKNKDYYKGRVVIIVDESTQSSAEYSTMALRVAPQVTVIGSTTAAADGNMSWFYLPGGIRTGMSGIGIYYPDGRETQRVGVGPDITIQPTIEGIRQGRDELLEKAIEIISQPSPANNQR